MKTNITIAVLACSFLFASYLFGQPQAAPQASSAVSSTMKANADFISRYGKSFVDVLYFIKPNRYGLKPDYSVRYLCPNCHEYHHRYLSRENYRNKPLVIPGVLVSPTQVISQKLDIPSDCIDHIEISQAYSEPNHASITAFFPQEFAIELTMDKPLADSSPVIFADTVKMPAKGCYIVNEDGLRVCGSSPLSPKDVKYNLDGGFNYVDCSSYTLLLDAEGAPVTLSFRKVHKCDEGFLPPSKWQKITFAEYEAKIKQTEKAIAKSFYTVTVILEPPPETPDFRSRYSFSNDDDKKSNRRNAIGLQLSPDKLLVFLNLDPDETARFSKAVVTLHDGKTVNASFLGSLRTYGMIMLKPEKPLDGTDIKLFTGATPAQILNETSLLAKINNNDGELLVDLMPSLAVELEVSSGRVPVVKPESDSRRIFVFSEELVLYSMPVEWRDNEDDSSDDFTFLSSAVLHNLLDSKTPFAPGFVPRTKAERKKLHVDFGVELQALNLELLKAKKVSKFFESGRYYRKPDGALVNVVTPGSLADSIGLRPEDILIYVRHIDSYNQIKISIESDSKNEFPWDEYDMLPEKYFDKVPQPWSLSDNDFNGTLQELGIGEELIIGFIRNGELIEKRFTLTASSETFDSATRYMEKTLGLTVADLTPDVRKYFKLPADTSAVVIAKVKPGSTAAKAGLKPYELILSIDGAPASDCETFKKLIEGKTELNLTVRRLVKSRIVKLSPKSEDKK